MAYTATKQYVAILAVCSIEYSVDECDYTVVVLLNLGLLLPHPCIALCGPVLGEEQAGALSAAQFPNDDVEAITTLVRILTILWQMLFTITYNTSLIHRDKLLSSF